MIPTYSRIKDRTLVEARIKASPWRRARGFFCESISAPEVRKAISFERMNEPEKRLQLVRTYVRRVVRPSYTLFALSEEALRNPRLCWNLHKHVARFGH
jgi:hypothetical protein